MKQQEKGTVPARGKTEAMCVKQTLTPWTTWGKQSFSESQPFKSSQDDRDLQQTIDMTLNK